MTEGSDGFNFNPDLLLNIPLAETIAFRVNAGMIDNDGIVDYPNVYRTDANGDPVVNGDVLTALPEYRRVKDVDYGRHQVCPGGSALRTERELQRAAVVPVAG